MSNHRNNFLNQNAPPDIDSNTKFRLRQNQLRAQEQRHLTRVIYEPDRFQTHQCRSPQPHIDFFRLGPH